MSLSWSTLWAVGFTISLVTIAYLYWQRTDYSRNKYAFYATGLLVTLATSSVLPIFSGSSVFKIIETLASDVLGIDVTSSPSTIYDKTLSLLLVGGLGYFILEMFKNWESYVEPTLLFAQQNTQEAQLAEQGLSGISFPDTWQLEPLYDMRKRLTCYANSRAPHLIFDEVTDWFQNERAFIATHRPSGKKNHIIKYLTNETSRDDAKALFEFCESAEDPIGNCLLITNSNVSKELIRQTYEEFFPAVVVEEAETVFKNTVNQTLYELSIETKLRQLLKIEGDDRSFDVLSRFVPLEVVTGNRNHADRKPTQTETAPAHLLLLEWIKLNKDHHIALLGDYGMGKTTLSHYVVLRALQDPSISKIPVVIELRGKSPRTSSPEELVFEWCKKFGVDTSLLLSASAEGLVVLIFEAFDEMDSLGDAELRRQNFAALWRIAEDFNARAVFTGRPNYFFDNGELQDYLRIKGIAKTDDYCVPMYLQLLKVEQIEKLLTPYPQDIRNEMLAVQKSAASTSMQDFLTRPSTLIPAATVWPELREQLIFGPITPAAVIDKFLRKTYERQTQKGLLNILSPSERHFFLTLTACVIHQLSPGTNQISSERLASIVNNSLDLVPRQIGKDSTFSREPTDLVSRLSDRQKIASAVATDVRTFGTLVDDDSRPGHLKFSHKSYYEYLVSVAYAYSIGSSALLDRAEPDDNLVIVTAILKSLTLRPLSRNDLPEIEQVTGEIYGARFSRVARSEGLVNEMEIAAECCDSLVGRFSRAWIGRSTRVLISMNNLVDRLPASLTLRYRGSPREVNLRPLYAPLKFVSRVYTQLLLLPVITYQRPLLNVWYHASKSMGLSERSCQEAIGFDFYEALDQDWHRSTISLVWTSVQNQDYFSDEA